MYIYIAMMKSKTKSPHFILFTNFSLSLTLTLWMPPFRVNWNSIHNTTKMVQKNWLLFCVAGWWWPHKKETSIFSHISHCLFLSLSLCVCVSLEWKWKLTQLPTGFYSLWFCFWVFSWHSAVSLMIGRHLSLMGTGEFSFLGLYTTLEVPLR